MTVNKNLLIEYSYESVILVALLNKKMLLIPKFLQKDYIW